MKKFILGILVGVAATAAGSAYADEIESVIGKAIQGQFPVKIEGKKLDTQAVVVDGTSYLPVRAIGEAFNMDVKFDADLGIELKPKGATTVIETPQTTATPSQPATGSTDEILVDSTQPVEYQIKYLKDEISGIEWNLLIWKDELVRVTGMTAERRSRTEKQIISNEARLAAMKSLLANLQAQQ